MSFRRTVLIGLLTASAGVALQAQSTDARLAWLQSNASPITTLEFDQSDDRDLASLGRAIGKSRLVFLGEQSHGDGATFAAKARIIKYLHRRRGFDLLVFESGFYDCRRTWVDATRGTVLADSAGGCMFALWSNSAQVEPLLRYLDQQKSADHPLELAGMDFQPSGRNASRIFDDLRRFASAQPSFTAVETDLAAFENGYRVAFRAPKDFLATADPDRESMRSAADRLAAWGWQRVDTLGSFGDPGFWRQAIGSIRAFADFGWAMKPTAPDPAVFNRRDSVMAANLVWLARQNPKRRIVVWGASSHFVRNRTGIVGDPAPAMVPAGHLVSAALGRAVYTIGFLATEGEIGFANPNSKTPRQPIARADETTLDGLMSAAGLDLAFLDLRKRRKGDDWLHRPLAARPLGYTTMTTTWPNHLDGFVFIRRMTPSLPR